MTFTNKRSGLCIHTQKGPKHTLLFCCFLAVLGSASAWGGWGTKSCYETYAQHVSAGQTVELCDDIEPDYCDPSINPGAKRGTCQGHGFAVPCISDSTGDKWLVKKEDTSALEGLGWTCPSESEKHNANNNIIAVTNNIEVATPTPKPTPKPTPSSEGWCKAGLFDVDQTVCCQSSCGKCGGDGCTSRPGGGDHCCAGGILRRGKVCSADTDTDCRFPRVNTVKYTYDLTDDPDDPGAKGAGNYDLDSYQGKHVFYQGHPGQSWGFTLSCEKVNTGTPRQAAVRAVYTDATPEDYNGPIVTDSGCSTYDFGPPHFKFSCCLDPSVPVPKAAFKADDSVATMTIDLAPQNKEPLKEEQNQLASKAATTHLNLRGGTPMATQSGGHNDDDDWQCSTAVTLKGLSEVLDGDYHPFPYYKRVNWWLLQGTKYNLAKVVEENKAQLGDLGVSAADVARFKGRYIIFPYSLPMHGAPPPAPILASCDSGCPGMAGGPTTATRWTTYESAHSTAHDVTASCCKRKPNPCDNYSKFQCPGLPLYGCLKSGDSCCQVARSRDPLGQITGCEVVPIPNVCEHPHNDLATKW